jgi:hypothetical protein
MLDIRESYRGLNHTCKLFFLTVATLSMAVCETTSTMSSSSETP